MYRNVGSFLLCWIFFQSLNKIYFYYIANFFQTVKCFLIFLLIFLHKMHIFSLIRISFTCSHFGKNMHQVLVSLLPLWPMKYLKYFWPKVNLLDTTVFVISILLIKIGFLYIWNSYSSISVSKSLTIFYPFFHLILIYNFYFLNLNL